MYHVVLILAFVPNVFDKFDEFRQCSNNSYCVIVITVIIFSPARLLQNLHLLTTILVKGLFIKIYLQ